MMQKRFYLSTFVLLLLLTAFSPVEREDLQSGPTTEQLERQIRDAIELVSQTYAPDKRVAVFDISWEREEDRLILKGEVDHPDARKRTLEAVREAGFDQVSDQIVVLPHPDLGQHTFGIVRVSVGNMRANPRFTAELVTQVLMGTPLKILKQRRGWFYVRSPDDYLGWISSGAFERLDEKGLREWKNANQVIVTSGNSTIYEKPSTESLPVSNVIIGNRMKQTGKEENWTAVVLSDGRSGYIRSENVDDYEHWRMARQLTGDNIAKTAKKFIGIPYLWGGTSAKGFDCSGLTKKVYWLNGMDLNRDASQQILMGRHVEPGVQFENLQKGDLLFFGRAETEDSPERIVHVGIYLGDKEFIHSSYLVRINSLDPDATHFDSYEYNRFVRARRLIP